MPRRRKRDKDDAERIKQRARSFRNRERRQRRTNDSRDASDLGWLKTIGIRMAAMKVLNATTSSHWPYWLSIPSIGKGRNHPTSDYYPCMHCERGGRVWYGFMFRDHRDEQCIRWPHARKELTPDRS